MVRKRMTIEKFLSGQFSDKLGYCGENTGFRQLLKYNTDKGWIRRLKWNRKGDTLSLNMEWWEKYVLPEKLTKRSALSMVQWIFDPIGIAIPSTLYLKLLVQCLWEQKVDWDETLKDDVRRPLENWLQSIPRVKERCINWFLGRQSKTSVHVFCDAGCKAYATVVFVCCEHNGKVKLELLQAKTRVAPLKDLTVPQQQQLEGPKWLEKREQECPCSSYSHAEEEIQQERTVRSITLINAKVDNWMYQYFSKYEHIVRMVGWILRFVNNCCPEKLKKISQLSLEEVERAKQTVWRLVQEESFMSPVHDQLSALRPFKDSHGLIRLNTKIIELKEDIAAFRTPVVLPSKHPVVERLVYDLHCKYNHVGAHSLLSLILPDLRVDEASIFEVVGIDLTGPLILRVGHKMWIYLFTCAIYEAIHLGTIPLTPSMFLQDIQDVGIPDCDANHACSMTRGEPLEDLQWERLSSLDQTISKDLNWPLAVIEQLIEGRNGQVRVL
ncbi:hypothetical protein PR048_015233 [Dryococelus australis]|uniref:Uncharacterized protein n=1 Tax=Dryococelus australis TaxID=614101 RepID=A0ABQ9HGN5_9NEOP|nr:hypothetical protein PR048_015233 [Dryococelus australis]